MASDLMGMRRIDLVGREKPLHEIIKLVRAKGVQGVRMPIFIHIEGEGGIGKTALLEKVRHDTAANRDISVSKIIDLYHLDNQTAFGFSANVVDALPEEIKGYFEEFKQRLKDFHEAQDRDQAREAEKLWIDTENAFVAALGKTARMQQVWLLLDTAETLHFRQGDEATKSGPAFEHISHWLLRIMPKLTGSSLVFLVAGRQSKKDETSFFARARKTPGWRVEDPIKLEPLDAKACHDYLMEVASTMEKTRPDNAESIRSYLREYGYDFLRRGTDGKPLYLAMVSDILSTGGILPESFYSSREAERSRVEELQILTDHFMSLPAPVGKTLRAMAALHKGVDAELLANVMMIDRDKAGGYLTQIGQLTLVKQRQGDAPRAYFLHDEIYELYANRAYPVEQGNAIYKRIFEYYDKFIKRLDRDMREHPHFLSRYQSRRHMAKIEFMHYTLWFHPWQGFAEYFSQSGSNLSVRIGDWEVLLEKEFTRTCNWLMRIGRFPDSLEVYVNWDGQIRAIERESLKPRNNALEMLAGLKEADTIPPFCRAYLWYVRGMMKLRGQEYTGMLSNPEFALDQAEELLKSDLPDPGLEKAVKVLQAFIENYRGYSARRAGRYEIARREYQKAAVPMRQYDLEGLSGVLTNQAYAMSMLGFDRRAVETAREAYEVARKSNSLRDQIRALNVRASAETLAGNHKNGERFAQQALELLHLSPEPRLQALVYVSLGRSYRYEWNLSLGDVTGEATVANYSLIAQGLAYFEGDERVRRDLKWDVEIPAIERGAIDFLKNSPDAENLSAARNECGCLWREAAWVLKKRSKDKRNELAIHAEQMAEDRLKEAAGVQQVSREKWLEAFKKTVEEIGGSPYWPTLALANLAWHRFYQGGNTEEVEQACKLVETAVEFAGRGDHLWRSKPPIAWSERKDHADVMLWGALGKMEMLRGYEALRDWRDDPARLERAVRHIALAMEYNYLIGQTNFNMKRAELGLENRIRQSEDWQNKLLPRLYVHALNIENNLGLSEGKKSRIMRWLEERYGDREQWPLPGGS